jgi:hypothetical protein
MTQQPARMRAAKWWPNEGHTEDSDAEWAAVDGGCVLGGAGATFNQVEGVMSEYIRRYKARWRMWLDALSWSQGPMATWKPVLTEQQKKEAEIYRIKNSLPF